MITTSTVKTAFGDAYMKRLCRHFEHKVPTSIDGQQGKIEFPFGVCRIRVGDQNMQFLVEVPNPDDMDRAERVVGDHLLRMANKDEPILVWERSGTPDEGSR